MKTSSSESDFGDYLSNLRKKTVGKRSDIHIEGLSDLSLSELSDNKDSYVPVKSKFLKNTSEKPETTKTISKVEKPKKKKKEKKGKKHKQNKNNENLTEKSKIKKFQEEFSDSEINLSSLSFKENKTVNNINQIPKLQLNSSLNKKEQLKQFSDEKSDENEGSSFGKDGNRFLKKKNMEIIKPPERVIDSKKFSVTDDISSGRSISSPRKSTLKSGGTSFNKKKVTILENKQDSLSSLEFEMQNSEEISKSKSDSESDNDKKFCGMNIMSLDDLVADEHIEDSIKESISEKDDYKPFGNIMSLEELENENKQPKYLGLKDLQESQESIDSLSEIKTVPSATPRRSNNLSKNQSISESIPFSQKDQSEINSVNSKLYSTEFEDSKIESIKTNNSVSKKNSPKSQSYSNDFTDEDDTLQSTSRNYAMKEQKSKFVDKNKMKYQRSDSIHKQHTIKIDKQYVSANVGTDVIEPVPIAPYVVSQESLESLSAYSPTMLLMTNMLRQQIQLTTSFIETHQRLYESFISSIQPTYQYSSLKEAKEFIKMNKSKPLTMKEALRLVEKEN